MSNDQDGADDDAIAVEAQTDGATVGAVSVGDQDAPVRLSDEIVDAVEAQDDVTLDDIAAAAVPQGDSDFQLAARTNADEGATIPVHDAHEFNLSSASRFDGTSAFGRVQDDQIRKLEENSVQYTEKVGDWILSRDDLVPGIKERMKGLILGEDGLDVEPSDPDSEADQRLAEHQEELYEGDIRPSEVIDIILSQNLKNARAVVRATDLKPIDLDTLTYIRDGVTGEEIYYQNPTSVQTFTLEDEGETRDFDLDNERIDGQPLVIGEQVFDCQLFDTPPLEAIADTCVNKMVMQRLKARKAEITSFGAVYAKVNPPEYLPEDEYFDYVQDPDGDEEVTKLERALNQNLDSAFETLKGFQSGTVMSVPMHWELEQLDIPEGSEPMDDQIRGYNQDIARRLLIPLDLIELQEGAELSRNTMFQTLMTTIRGWRQEIKRVFDDFARIQKTIHDVDGSVEHTFPALGDDADAEIIAQLLNFAGLAGMTEKEVRKLMNKAGADLTIDEDMDTLPEAGGPSDPGERQAAMARFLDERDDEEDGQGADDWVPSSRREAMEKNWSPVVEVDAEELTLEADAFEADVFRVALPDDHDQDGFDDDVVGIGIDFPNDDVFVDWRNEVFPDELEDSHVSIYSSIDDLERATGNVVEPIETVGVQAALALSEDIEAAHGFTGPDSLREAGHQVRRAIDDATPDAHTVEVTHPSDSRVRLVVHDEEGNFAGSASVRRSSTDADDWLVVGADGVFANMGWRGGFREIDEE